MRDLDQGMRRPVLFPMRQMSESEALEERNALSPLGESGNLLLRGVAS